MLPGGNGHGAPIALSLDALAIAIAVLSTASQARSDRLTNGHLSGLPAFLLEGAGGHSGLMIPLRGGGAGGENRSLAAPASVHTVTTCAGQEDHISQGVNAARKALDAVANAVDIVAIELLCAAQALDFHRSLRPSRGARAMLAAIRSQVPCLTQDRELWRDLAALRQLMTGGVLLQSLQPLLEERE
ncbi:Histidine ammonia-lyase [Sodalis praecaptivus]